LFPDLLSMQCYKIKGIYLARFNIEYIILFFKLLAKENILNPVKWFICLLDENKHKKRMQRMSQFSKRLCLSIKNIFIKKQNCTESWLQNCHKFGRKHAFRTQRSWKNGNLCSAIKKNKYFDFFINYYLLKRDFLHPYYPCF